MWVECDLTLSVHSQNYGFIITHIEMFTMEIIVAR